MPLDSRAVQDAFTSMLRTDYIPLKDTARLNLLSRYYVDYFGYLSQIVGEQDQLIVGRRGTGKTTLLYRGLIECMASWTDEICAAKPRTLGIYLDLSKCQLLTAEPDEFLAFEHLVVSEICDAISDELMRSWPELNESPGLFDRLFQSVEQQKREDVKDLMSQLATVLTNGKPRFFERSGRVDSRELGKTSVSSQSGIEVAASLKKLGVNASSSSKADSAAEFEETTGYEVTYRLSVNDILKVIDELRAAAGIPTVILFIDEFSSLTEELQRRFTTLLKSLLGNHAGLFVKLCAITDNYTLGSSVILQRDLFEVSLDFDAFVDRSGSLKGAMSELEVLTEKIVRERLKVFANAEPQELFDDPTDAWTELSRESMGVPRTIGIALQKAWYRAKVSQRTKLQKTDIEYGIGYASKAYLSQMLGASKDGVAVPSYIGDIWDAILERAIAEKPKSDSAASHFMVLPKNEAKLKLLNMFFVVHLLTGGRTTKKEKASRSLYAIDYGICLEYRLGYGDDKNVLRQQRFAYDDSLAQFDKFFQIHEEVMYVCPTCKAVYSETDLMVKGQMLKFCMNDKSDLQRLHHDPTALKYTEEEIKIIGSIRSSGPNDRLTARQVADDVGCYVQKVAKFGERLDREEIIDRQKLETLGDACFRLLRRMTVQQPVEVEDFNRDYSDGKFWRFLLYLMVHKNEAHDWDKAGARLGFDGAELLTDFRPQWHHIFPQKFLAKKVESQKIDALANIAVIGPDINIRISAQDPMKYLDKYAVTDEKLAEQFIVWNRTDFSLEKFDDFLAKRADQLRTAANDFLLDLSEGLPDDCRPNKAMAVGVNGAGK